MNRKFLLLIAGVFLFCLWLGITIYTFTKDEGTPPITEAEIPESTKQFFRQLGELGHIQIEWVKKIKEKEYDNDNDEGQKSGDFRYIEDGNFVVYFRDNSLEKIRAERTLKQANNAIRPLAELFGKYFYPAIVKGRKLPIYLATDSKDYTKILSEMGGQGAVPSVGITYMKYSSDGDNLCSGIVLNGEIEDESYGSDYPEIVLRHEMAHYVHLTSIDYYKKNGYLGWECEGIAGYFANEERSIPPPSSINKIHLDKDCENYHDNYWVGLKVFEYIESQNGKDKVKEFLQKSYYESAVKVIPVISNQPFQKFEEGWKIYCVNS